MKFSKEYEAELIARSQGRTAHFVIVDEGIDPPLPTILGAMGAWTFRIPDWAPTPVNKLYDHHWASRRKHKKSDAEIVAYYARNVPKASQKRAVSLHVVFPPGKRMPDVDAYAKSLLDSLVHCKLLVNDSSAWCVLNPVAYSRGQVAVSFITVEDV